MIFDTDCCAEQHNSSAQAVSQVEVNVFGANYKPFLILQLRVIDSLKEIAAGGKLSWRHA
jgi:hypothetical protein